MRSRKRARHTSRPAAVLSVVWPSTAPPLTCAVAPVAERSPVIGTSTCQPTLRRSTHRNEPRPIGTGVQDHDVLDGHVRPGQELLSLGCVRSGTSRGGTGSIHSTNPANLPRDDHPAVAPSTADRPGQIFGQASDISHFFYCPLTRHSSHPSISLPTSSRRWASTPDASTARPHTVRSANVTTWHTRRSSRLREE